MCLIDATYKTTCYELPLLILAVPTNVGFFAVATFVINDECSETILAALCVLQNWNPGARFTKYILAIKLVVFDSHSAVAKCVDIALQITKTCPNCVLRTAVIHSSHLAAVAVDSNRSKTRGMKSESVFHSLNYSLVTESSPPDAMHDILECLCPINNVAAKSIDA